MNSRLDDESDIWQQISMPQWIMENINNLQEPSFVFDSAQFQEEQKPSSSMRQMKIHEDHNIQNSSENTYKRKNPVSYQISYQRPQTEDEFKCLDCLSQSPEDQNDWNEEKNEFGTSSINIPNDKTKYKKEQRCKNSRKYRQKKKQLYKSLDEQNRFLKFKVDELTFRINQLQTEINKLKNSTQTHLDIQNFHTVKFECHKQIQTILQNDPQLNQQEYFKLQQKLQSVIAFDGKQKLDLLNYFMSQLMDNVINDKIFYFLDCLINKRGIHRIDESIPLRRIDLEVIDILKIHDKEKQQAIKKKHIDAMKVEAQKFQQLWKKLYQVYLAILNQGFRMQRHVQPLKMDLMRLVQVEDYLRLELHFEKNKFRPDIRQMRSLWFKELERENDTNLGYYQQHKKNKVNDFNKRVKNENE